MNLPVSEKMLPYQSLSRFARRFAHLLAPERTIMGLIGSYHTPDRAPSEAMREELQEFSHRPSNCVKREIASHPYRLMTYCWGDPESQPYLLFSHGWSGSGLIFEAWVDRCLSAGFSVVSFDQQGHGLSSGSTATLLDFAGNLRTVGHYFGRPNAIIGHGIGGTAAVRALIDGLASDHLVLVAAQADPVAALRRFGCAYGLTWRETGKVIEMIDAHSNIPLEEQQAHRTIPKIATPTLVIHDVGDSKIPWEEGERYARFSSNAQLLSTSGLDYDSIATDDSTVDATLRFVRGETVASAVVSSQNLRYGFA
jgi:pimeloyl-ACP methyl ester carboxylesterase